MVKQFGLGLAAILAVACPALAQSPAPTPEPPRAGPMMPPPWMAPPAGGNATEVLNEALKNTLQNAFQLGFSAGGAVGVERAHTAEVEARLKWVLDNWVTPRAAASVPFAPAVGVLNKSPEPAAEK